MGATLAAGAAAAGAGVATKPGPSAGGAAIDTTYVAPPINVTAAVAAEAAIPKSTQTSCTSLVQIGDSTSEGLVSHDYLPNPKQRISARYAHVGVRVEHFEISGARSIVERYQGEPNAYDVARKWKDRGFGGCWVLALGTNEAANVAAGSTIGFDERIAEMMHVADGDPVLWVNVRSIVSGGPYSAASMRAWDDALLKACAKYPNMRVYDWASDVRDSWFIDDGIHFTSQGYAQRARLIAAALARAFPANETMAPPGCVV